MFGQWSSGFDFGVFENSFQLEDVVEVVAGNCISWLYEYLQRISEKFYELNVQISLGGSQLPSNFTSLGLGVICKMIGAGSSLLACVGLENLGRFLFGCCQLPSVWESSSSVVYMPAS